MTPGPWYARGSEVNLSCWVSTRDVPHGPRICTITEGPNDWDNARLIAAAPDLLHALKELQQAVRDCRLLDVKKRFTLCAADAQANTAIAKAEGKP